MCADAQQMPPHENTQARTESSLSDLKETLRDSDLFFTLKNRPFKGVFSRDVVSPQAAEELLKQIDSLTASAKVLKNGNTCFVTAVDWCGRKVVIKRYNPKGLLHSLRHTLKRSRARRGWLNAHRLRQLCIPTPKPLGFVEEYAGILLKRSWLITELAPGPKLRDYLADPTLTKTQKTTVIEQVFAILAQLEENRITHGDLKHVNLIITPNGATLIDLDSVKIHRTGLFFAYHRKKDLDAFDFGQNQ